MSTGEAAVGSATSELSETPPPPTLLRFPWVRLAAVLAFVAALTVTAILVVPVPTPIDEVFHVDVIRSLADEGRRPQAGRDLIDPRLQYLSGHGHTAGNVGAALFDFREDQFVAGRNPVPPVPASSYEGYHPPLYYALAAPWYRLVRSGDETDITSLRLFNVFCIVAAALMAALASWEWFPGRADVALMSAALLGAWNGGAGIAGQITNDALVPFCGALVMYAVARTWRRGDRIGWALIPVSAAVCLLTKSSTVPLVLVMVATAAVLLWRDRRRWRELAPALGAATVVSAAAVTHYVLTQLATYGDLGATAAVRVGVGDVHLPEAGILRQLVDQSSFLSSNLFTEQLASVHASGGAVAVHRTAALAVLAAGFVLTVWRTWRSRRLTPDLWLYAAAGAGTLFMLVWAAAGDLPIPMVSGRMVVWVLPFAAAASASVLCSLPKGRWIGAALLLWFTCTNLLIYVGLGLRFYYLGYG